MCRRVRTWHDCFQCSVYDNGREELSVETLTQPGTSRGGGWDGAGESQGDREGQRDVERETEAEREGQTETYSKRDTERATHRHTHVHAHSASAGLHPSQAQGPGRSEMGDKSSSRALSTSSPTRRWTPRGG